MIKINRCHLTRAYNGKLGLTTMPCGREGNEKDFHPLRAIDGTQSQDLTDVVRFAVGCNWQFINVLQIEHDVGGGYIAVQRMIEWGTLHQ